MRQLNQQNLAAIDTQISKPSFDRSELKTGIVHIGVGGFHRAHQAYYLQKLTETSNSDDWGICGIGLREEDRNISAILKKQDHLYSLLVKHPNGTVESHIIGAIVDYKFAIEDVQSVIDELAHKDTKIVSLTITEGGYNFNPSTGEFDFKNPIIQEELRRPEKPKSVYGYLAAALKKRRDNKLPAFTILSCDNIEHNGDVTKKMLLAFTQKQNPELAKWIQKEVKFPNSMVDRITPVTTTEDISFIAEKYGLKDEWPVTSEPFIQWVVEDKFSNGRPNLEKVGVQFVPDVKPYEKMKLRLLNAGHSVLGILGALNGYKTINECIDDSLFNNYLKQFMDLEVTPVLDTVNGIDLGAYKQSLRERFANPNIKDSVSRICSESAAKLPKFLIPTIKENLVNEGNIALGTLVISAWCYYSDKQTDLNDMPLDVIDSQKVVLEKTAQKGPLTFIQQETIFGDLAKNERFVTLYETMVKDLYHHRDVKKQMGNLV
ncbi:mannitol dehydrogenase family protein [Croceitalea rosinachiae]|uniref:Mannitol dehydrogenase family protein n=1 Tax=Croceitalea rosinachiae TaxID=3075596 RepID=A0ABU3A8Z8_9FLAO|nr:mannitol dehydrogenase family protein [Croceitalea sp. F388]MDT0605563.1 mannitol dehydrogenase family protein [Croceitalea sp. F388]